MADGIFTPAVSVTSAVAGIGVAKPSVVGDITGISIVSPYTSLKQCSVLKTTKQAFLVALFLVQQFGTARLSFLFSPGK